MAGSSKNRGSALYPARSVSCPACGANIGKPCILTSGKNIYYSHKARRNKYLAAFGKGKPTFLGNK